MRLAIATWDGRISPVFDVALQILIFDLPSEADHSTSSTPVGLLPGPARVDQLVTLKITALICGGISCALHQQIEARGIEVVHNVAGAIPEVLARYAADQLPGCPRRQCGQGRSVSERGRCRRTHHNKD